MHFGIMLPHFRQAASPDGIIRVAQEAEAMGFDSVWVSEHLAIPTEHIERRGAVWYEATTVLGFAAAVTKRILLGSSVLVMPLRSPVLTAKAVATVDVLSGGRVLFGAGVGGFEGEFAVTGADYANRGDVTNEALALIKQIWGDGPADFQGRFWQVSDVVLEPKPLQKPHPPIWIGGSTGRALRRVAEHGDVWHPTRPTTSMIREGREKLARLCEPLGRDASAISIALRHCLLFTDAPAAPDTTEPLIGAEDDVIRSLEAFQEAGVTAAVLDMFYGTPEVTNETPDTMLKTMERLMANVAPRFQ